MAIKKRKVLVDGVATRCVRPAVTKVVNLEFDPLVEPSLTQQAFVNECDIHTILRKYHDTGIMPSGTRVALTGDFSDVEDYQSALAKVIAAQDLFGELPSHVRDRFGNDPSGFLAFVQDPRNGSELVKLGLATERVVEQPAKDKVASGEKA